MNRLDRLFWTVGACLFSIVPEKSVAEETAKPAPVAQAGTGSSGSASGISVDDIFDWKSPSIITQAEFESKLKASEQKAGSVFSSPGRAFQKIEEVKHETRLSFSQSTGVKATILGGLYAVESATVASHADGLKIIEYARLKEADGSPINPLRAVGLLDGIFGSKHALKGNFHVWNTGLYLVQFFQYSGSTEYALRFQRVRAVPVAPDASVAVSQSTVTPAPQPAGGSMSSKTPDIEINVDEIIDWKNPLDLTKLAFHSAMRQYEKIQGKPVYTVVTSGTDESSNVGPLFVKDYAFTMKALGGAFSANQLSIYWRDGKAKLMIISFTSNAQAHGTHESFMGAVEKLYGTNHSMFQSDQGDHHRWNLDGFLVDYSHRPGGNRFVLSLSRTSTPATAQRTVAVAATPTPSPTVPVPAPPASSASSVPVSDYFKLRLTQINGLLISPLSSGEEAGQSTKMTLTALPDRGKDQTWLEFNQEVGGDMRRCLLEVSKHSQIRHKDWPLGYTLQIGFEDKYIEKDGPSAAVACALLVESAVTGKKWAPDFAVTGDMNADGSVQPIGGVRAKVRGATKGGCRVVAVPSKNEVSIPDILLLDGAAPLVSITVFGIKTFDEAMILATPEHPKALSDALLNFEAMRPTLMRDQRQILPLLRTPQGIARLQALLQAAPNCYSAKYLLLLAQGRAPKSISIGGSIEAAQSSAQGIINSIENDVESNVKTLKPDEVGTSLNKLRNLRPMLDQRVWPYVDALVDYGDVVRGAILNPVRSGARYVDLVTKARRAASAAQTAFKTLMGNAAVREELGL